MRKLKTETKQINNILKVKNNLHKKHNENNASWDVRLVQQTKLERENQGYSMIMVLQIDLSLRQRQWYLRQLSGFPAK